MATLGNFDRIWTFLGHSVGRDPVQRSVSQDHIGADSPIHLGDIASTAHAHGLAEHAQASRVPFDRSGDGDAIARASPEVAPSDPRISGPRRLFELGESSDAVAHRRESLIQRSTTTAGIEAEKASSYCACAVESPLQTLSESEPRQSTSRRAQQFRHGRVRSRGAGYRSEPDRHRVNNRSLSSGNALRLSAAKKRTLISLLWERFQHDRGHLEGLASPLPPPQHASDADIHVFVDLSNVGALKALLPLIRAKQPQILIGFHETIQRSTRTRLVRSNLHRQSFSFHGFSMILERNRPAVRRVVAGSDDTIEVEEARALGYEANILRRVVKAGESGSVPISDQPGSRQTCNVRSVEQGVDEILHLKIAQSLLDTASPATIVLASGDAAEAEFSDGFLRMLARALTRGWTTELVAFKSNVSSAYRAKEWRNRWASRFKIIELDEYADLLHLGC